MTDVTDQPVPSTRVNRVIRHPQDLREGMFIENHSEVLYVSDCVESPDGIWTAYVWDGMNGGVVQFGLDGDRSDMAVKQIVPPRFVDPR
jgi:hypothetical protein